MNHPLRFHKLLQRQLGKHLSGEIPEQLIPFLRSVEQSYQHFENDRVLLERVMELSSQELTEANRELVKESSRQRTVIDQLKNAVQTISKSEVDSSENDLLQLTSTLQSEIEKRQAAEEKIARSEKKYRQLINNMELGLVEMDRHGKIVNVSAEFVRISGFVESELLGSTISDLIADETQKEVCCSAFRTMLDDKQVVFEVPIRHRDGTIRWMVVSGVPIQDETRPSPGLLTVYLDITQLKNIEELNAARERAEALLKSKEQFLANISHEIRTPMNGILGLSELLQKTVLMGKQQKYVDAIHTSAKGLLVIINDILDLTKYASGKFCLEEIEFDPRTPVNNIHTTLGHLAGKKGIYLKLEIDDQVPSSLLGDPTRLEQVITNLAGNAIKFTSKGGVTLKVDFASETEDWCNLVFSVTDTGIGIAKEKKEFIFDYFAQADDSTSRRYGGTGLGLAITKQLAELFGGEILLKSELNQGSEFSFHVGFKKSHPKESKVVVRQQEYNLNCARVLVVDDNEINLLVVSSILENWNTQVEKALNGQEAVDLVKENDYDLILMDLQMPIMDGFEASTKIRNELKKKTPIIAVTANDPDAEWENCLAAGMNEFVPKPLDADRLYLAITCLCNIHGSPRSFDSDGIADSENRQAC